MNLYKKITIINQSSGYLTVDMANVFAEKYEEVVLVTGKIDYNNSRLNENVKIVKKIKYRRNKSYLRVLTWVIFQMQSFLYILFNVKYGRLFFVTNPPITPFLGSFFLNLRNLEYDILVYDIYPDALLNFGYVKTTSVIYKYWTKLNYKAYKNADRIFTISKVMKNVLAEEASVNKIEVVYPWVDTSYIRPIDKKDNWFAKKYNLLDKKVILYSGNMGLTHDLNTILLVAKELNCSKSEYHFLFVGDGAQKKELKRFSETNKLSNVTFLPYQDADVLPYSFSSADYSIISLGKGMEGLSVPSKSFYYFAAGSAIISISEKGSEIENLVNKFNLGISVVPGEKAQLRTFLKDTNDSKLKEYKENSRDLSQKFTKGNARKFI
ncbi:glycosyltransferase family 4 protein [Labilibaculum euxinus]|uniref:Glycosyltransferase n=1 Tax=Labilibaculum euxinus TaxID=2686357 RepID=A0A7M4DAG3_9BACT|nr:glycosyltransferase family 4 protein [Labilibaculum euxinus]MUP39642.1 glycosyltransferase [Labilibaculum euxinus]MVB08847.1 glycosyltransferase [Labilibaculum euxinus]